MFISFVPKRDRDRCFNCSTTFFVVRFFKPYLRRTRVSLTTELLQPASSNVVAHTIADNHNPAVLDYLHCLVAVT